MPIKQFQIKKNLFYEKHITLAKNKTKLLTVLKKAKKKQIKEINKLGIVVNDGTVEYPLLGNKYLKKIINKIKKYGGGLLFIDYGYIKSVSGDTLQSIKKHKYTDPFLNPGNADITSHVNFKLMYELLKKNGLDVNQVVTQNEFLQKLGIKERANILSKKLSFKKKIEMFYSLDKLLSYKEMGQIFKVIFAKKKGKKFSLGF